MSDVTPERPSPPLDQGVPWSPVEQALAEECARQFEIPRNRAYRQVRGIMRGVAEATGASPVDTVDDWLLSDIESVIHQHCGSDGSDDAHNDWVNDLANAVAVVIRPSSNSAGIVPDPPADQGCRLPAVDWEANPHRLIDALDDWGVHVEDDDGLTAVGVFRRVTEPGEEIVTEPGWSDPEIYLIDIRDTVTDELVLRTDIRNLTKVVVL